MMSNQKPSHLKIMMRVVLLAAICETPLWLAGSPAFADHFAEPVTQSGPDEEEDPDPGCSGPNCECTGDPISVYSGKWIYQHVDLEVPGTYPIQLVRHYDALTTYQSPLGFGWAFNYDMRLFEYPDGSIIVRSKCGQRHHYDPIFDGGPDPVGWQGEPSRTWNNTIDRDPLTPGGYVVREPGGSLHFFDANGSLVKTQNPQGHSLVFSYTPTKQLITGTSPYAVDPSTPMVVSQQFQLTEIAEEIGGALTGREVTFSYDPVTGRLEWAKSHDGRQVTYTHEEAGGLPTGNLLNVELPDGIVQTFTYDDSGDPKTAHRVESIQDGQGMAFYTNTYDATGRIDTQTVDGAETRIIFDPIQAQLNYAPDFTTTDRACDVDVDCRLVERDIVDSDGTLVATAKTLYKFDIRGLAVEIIDALGHQTLHTYESSRPFRTSSEVYFNEGTPTNPVRNVLEKHIEYVYGSDGQLESQETWINPDDASPDSITEAWEYTDGWVKRHTVTSTLEPGRVFETTYRFERAGEPEPEPPVPSSDPITNIYQVKRFNTYPNSTSPEVTTFHYDSTTEQLVTVELPDGHKITRTYYENLGDLRRGRVKEIYHDDGAGGVDLHLKVTYDYDGEGNLASITDARGHVTQQIWENGRLVEVVNPLLESTLFTYGSPDGSEPGRLLYQVEVGRVKDGGEEVEGQVTRNFYDTRGNLVEVKRKNDWLLYLPFASFAYDSDNNQTLAVDGEGRQIISGYDLLGRRVSAIDLASHQTSFFYDASGNQINVMDAASIDRVFVYDGLDRLVESHEPDLDASAITILSYDAVGNLTAVEDANNHVTSYKYDDLSRLRQVDRPLADGGGAPVTTISYNYDLRGRLKEWINGRGNVLRYEYEDWGPVETIEHFTDLQDLVADRTLAYTYDDAGNVLTVSDSALSVDPLYESTSNDYDQLNRLLSVEIGYLPGPTKSLSYTYDRFGNKGSVTLETVGASPVVHSYVFNLRNQLATATFKSDAAGSPEQVYSFTYLKNDDLERIEHPNGLTTTYAYRGHGPIQSIAVTGGPAPVTTLDYTARDELDRVKTLIETTSIGSSTWSYNYDAGGRIEDAAYPANRNLPATEDFAYDLVGNREDPGGNSAIWDYDDNDQIQGSPGTTYDFDDDGNVSKVMGGAATNCGDTDVACFGFDYVNRLESYSKDSAIASYAYDPYGRRVKKTYGSDTTWYVWDGDRLLAEFDDASEARTASYGYAGGFAPIYFEAQQEAFSVHSDHLDTPRALSDSDQRVVWRQAHRAFGMAEVEEDPDADQSPVVFNVRFPGQYFDEESQLHYNRHRYYDPSIGRYLSADPFVQVTSPNSYPYVENDPLQWVDPWGLFKADVHRDALRAWAQDAGIPSGDGQMGDIISRANQEMDNPGNFRDFPLYPWGCPKHFRDRGEVMAALAAAIAACDEVAFGRNLHAYQDTFSHAGKSCKTAGHVPQSIASWIPGLGFLDPDDFDPGNDLMDRIMEDGSRYYLEKFAENCCTKP